MRTKHSPASAPGIDALSKVFAESSRKARRPSPSVRILGAWALGVDYGGNLTATYVPTGDVTVLALVPAGEVGSDG